MADHAAYRIEAAQSDTQLQGLARLQRVLAEVLLQGARGGQPDEALLEQGSKEHRTLGSDPVVPG